MKFAIESRLLANRIEDFGEAEALKVAELGFDGIACEFGARIPGWSDPDEISSAECIRVRELLERHGLGASYSWSYWGALVHTDEAMRREGIRISIGALRIARDLGAPCATLGPGSNDPTHGWFPHRDNVGPASFGRFIRSIAELAPVAEEYGVEIVLKGHTLSTLDTVEKFAQVIHAVGSPSIKAGCDPVNLMRLEYVWDSAAYLRHMFDVLGDDLVLAHSKDYALDSDLVLRISERPPGRGWLDYETYIDLYQRQHPNGWMAIEHVELDETQASREFLANIANRDGRVS